MDAVDFLNSDEADLPKTRVGDFPTFLDGTYTAFRGLLGRIAPRSDIDRVIVNETARVEQLSDAMRDVVRLVIAGDRDAAYARLDAELRRLGPRFRVLMPQGDMSQVVNPMYRFRYAGPNPHPPGGLFHIPFQSVHLVREMRYSVAGLPSLYLGGSTDVCWRELREPDLAHIAVSRFYARPGTGLRVLNFGHRLPVFAAWVDNKPGDFVGPTTACAIIAAHVACWPLIAASSIRVPDPSRPERPEYIIPQLVLEWITRTHAYHGIRYFSTHYAEYPDDPKTYLNYVFPASTRPALGYCRGLCDLFELTDPVSWAQAKAASAAGVPRPRYKTRGVLDAAREAEFGRAEDGLLSLPIRPLAPVPDYMRAELRTAVQVRAYTIWESEHHLHGRDREHWFRAKHELGIPDDILV